MLIHLDLADGSWHVQGADDLKSLAVELHGEGSAADVSRTLAGLGTYDGEHVWLDVAALRDAAGEGQGPDWRQGYEGMIAYARSKGWTDDRGAHVRAHVDDNRSDRG